MQKDSFVEFYDAKRLFFVFFSRDREIQKGIDWIFSEPLLLYYVQIFKDSMWPGGDWKGNARGSPSKELVTETRKKARQKFLENLPGILTMTFSMLTMSGIT